MKHIKLIRKILVVGILTVCTLLAVGIIYEVSAEYLDSKKYLPPGEVFEINGHKMHLYAEGTSDTTVVFASGFGIPSPYVDFYPLYNEISKQARIVVYDRPGYGWSESSDSPRDIDTIVSEMHELLEKAGEKPPYIFVGHSLASLEIIRFAQIYKDEVKGIVTIDAGNPEFYAKETITDEALSAVRLKFALNKLGVFRLLFNHSPDFYSSAYAHRNQLNLVSKELREMDKALYLKNMINKSKTNEYNNIKTNGETVVKSGKLENIPLRILTSEEESKDAKWKMSQEAFKDWSSDSTQKIVKGANHNIHQYVPEIINVEILSLLKE